MPHPIDQIYSNPIMAYAHHRIVFDEAGTPCDYEFLAVNEAFERFTGLNKEYLIGRTVRQAIPGIERSDFDWIGCYAEVARGGGFKTFDGHSEQLGKSYRVHVFSTEESYFTTVFFDITEHKKISESVKASEANFRALFDSMQDMVVVGTPEGRVLYANDSTFRTLGFTLDELDSIGIVGIHPEPFRKEAEAIFAAMFKGERDFCPLPVRRKDGSSMPVETRVSFGKWDGRDCIFGVIKDLSKEQDALQRFDRLFDLNPSMMALSLLPERRFVEVNRAFCSNIGLVRDQIIGKTAIELGLFLTPEALRNSSDTLNRDGCVRNMEMQFRTADDSLRDGLFSGEIIEIQGKRYFLSVMVDITDRKATEDKFRRQTGLISSLLDSIPDIVFFKDVHGVYLGCNPSFAEFAGKEGNEIVGATDHDLFEKEIADGFRTSDLRILQELVPRRHEVWITYPDGRRILVDTMKTPYRGPDGELIGILGISRDITRRKAAEEAQKRQAAYMTTIIENQPGLVWLKDQHGMFLAVNQAFAAACGRTSPTEIVGLTDFDIWPVDLARKYRSDDEEVMASGVPKSVEEIIADRTGESWAETFKSPVRDEHGMMVGTTGYARDISERKRSEAELRNAKIAAEAASKSKSEFLANMSHEIRTPLNGVIGFTELLKSTPLSTIQKQYVDNANVSGHNLLEIINDILDFSKIEAGMMELESVRTDMVELLESSTDILTFNAGKKNLELLVDIDPSMPRFAMVDPIRLRQVLANLLGNAVKFTEQGEVELKVVYEQIADAQGKFKISVRDTGIGISELQRTKLFKAFSQADSSTTRKFGGTGLGLIISDMIIRKMGGKIHVESAPGSGSIFSFELTTGTENVSIPGFAPLRDVARCLVVDDNANSRRILERTLQQWNITVESCDNGLSALKLLETSKPFDAIVCDHDMPYLDGLETIRLIRTKLNLSPEKLPIILLHSASADTELHVRCDELGVRIRSIKPVKHDELYGHLAGIRSTSQPNATGPVAEGAQRIGNFAPQSLQPNSEFCILLADDASINMLLAKGLIQLIDPSIKILEATTGSCAVEQFTAWHPDLILMDVQMPEMDGLEATRSIRAREEGSGMRTPIVALTAGAFQEEKDRCFAAGMDQFLTKPIDPDKLKEAIDRYRAAKTARSATVHFDRERLLLRCNPSIFQAITECLAKDMPTYLESLASAIASGIATDIETHAHRLKGACLNAELPTMATISEAIEEVPKTGGDLASLPARFEELLAEWALVKTEIA